MDAQSFQPPLTPQDEKAAIAQIAQAIEVLTKEMGGIRQELSRANEELFVKRVPFLRDRSGTGG